MTRKWIQATVAGILLSSGLVWNVRADTNEHDDNNFREDVIVCEEAVSHIAQCCPTLTAPANACYFYHYKKIIDCGCSSGTRLSEYDDRRPVLSMNESETIIDSSCSEINCEEMYRLLQRPHGSANSHSGQCN